MTDLQLHALAEVGIPAEWAFVDKISITDRPGPRVRLGYAGDGDVIVVHTPGGGSQLTAEDAEPLFVGGRVRAR